VAVVPGKNGIAVELTVEPKGRHFPRAFRGFVIGIRIGRK
jgi:hypothetical protein